MSTEKKKGRYYCGHCGKKVSKTLYFNHKRAYYIADTEEWIKTPAAGRDHEVDFTFSDSEDGVST